MLLTNRRGAVVAVGVDNEHLAEIHKCIETCSDVVLLVFRHDDDRDWEPISTHAEDVAGFRAAASQLAAHSRWSPGTRSNVGRSPMRLRRAVPGTPPIGQMRSTS